MCGEKRSRPKPPHKRSGSPPRVRGEASSTRNSIFWGGITPACAGRRTMPRLLSVSGLDHPRVCGEKMASLAEVVLPLGSPPRVRGEARDRVGGRDGDRITPACAGRRDRPVPRAYRFSDHPRVCGEKITTRSPTNCLVGSPPRVRGEERRQKDGNCGHGITPACAGRRNCRRIRAAGYWDHPRVCGEKSSRNTLLFSREGSPPRVRGEAPEISALSSMPGITPACAGRSISSPRSGRPLSDHPRVCGEKRNFSMETCHSQGSPPRVRGEANVGEVRYGAVGITPACAGRSERKRHRSRNSGDHPRVCGEKDLALKGETKMAGSPPRVRGEASLSHHVSLLQRITPACAGRRYTVLREYAVYRDHPRVCGEKACSLQKKRMRSGSPPRVRGEGSCRSCTRP